MSALEIPEHECPIVRPRRTLPVMGPYPDDWVAFTGSTSIFYVDQGQRSIRTNRRAYALEPATLITCQLEHRHIAALRFAPDDAAGSGERI